MKTGRGTVLWDIRNNVTVCVEGPVEIRIAGRLSTGQNSSVAPCAGATELDATDIVIYVHGVNGGSGNVGATPKAAKFGLSSTVVANVYAPNGTVWLRQNADGTGAFLGRWIVVGIGATVDLESGW